MKSGNDVFRSNAVRQIEAVRVLKQLESIGPPRKLPRRKPWRLPAWPQTRTDVALLAMGLYGAVCTVLVIVRWR